MSAVPVASALFVLTALLLGDKGPPSEINASPGGKMKIIYGAPTWRDEFASQWKDQKNWRLGSGGDTTLDTAGGLIFADCVVFPGVCNVGLTAGGGDTYVLVFHHDGQTYKGGACEGKATLTHYDLDPKKAAKALEIGFPKNKEGDGYVWTIRFGPHEMSGPFTTAKAKTVKGKFKDVPTELTVLERADLEALAKDLEKNDVTIAKADAKKGKILRTVKMKGGNEPKLSFLKPEETTTLSTMKGTARDAAKPAKVMTFAFETTKEGTNLVIGVGAKEFVFPTTEDVMKE